MPPAASHARAGVDCAVVVTLNEERIDPCADVVDFDLIVVPGEGIDRVARIATIRPLRGEASDYDWLIERATDKRFVLLGEASHGTEEFYRERAQITKRLIAEAGFNAVAVEADWPDAYRVNRYVRGVSDDTSAEEALSDFRRFPVWMWRNIER